MEKSFLEIGLCKCCCKDMIAHSMPKLEGHKI
jgi:hypothetical protein